MTSMKSAEIQYVWEAIRESERSDENLFTDAVEPEPGHGDFSDEQTAQADALRRTTA